MESSARAMCKGYLVLWFQTQAILGQNSGSFSLSFHFSFHSVLQQSGIKNLKGFNIQNVHHLQFYAFTISTLFLYLLKILPVSYKELESYQKY